MNVFDIKTKSMPVVVSSWQLKFYEQDGWTKALLDKYVKSGGFLKRGHDGDRDGPHWVPELGSEINYDQMYADGHISRVLDKGLFNDLTCLSDLEILKKKG